MTGTCVGPDSPSPETVTPTSRFLSVAGSVIGPFGPSTLSVTLIGWPSFALGGLAVITARTAPCQKTVALTSWLARPGGAVRWIFQVPTSSLVMLLTCKTSTGEVSCPLIAEESVHDWPSGREKLT